MSGEAMEVDRDEQRPPGARPSSLLQTGEVDTGNKVSESTMAGPGEIKIPGLHVDGEIAASQPSTAARESPLPTDHDTQHARDQPGKDHLSLYSPTCSCPPLSLYVD